MRLSWSARPAADVADVASGCRAGKCCRASNCCSILLWQRTSASSIRGWRSRRPPAPRAAPTAPTGCVNWRDGKRSSSHGPHNPASRLLMTCGHKCTARSGCNSSVGLYWVLLYLPTQVCALCSKERCACLTSTAVARGLLCGPSGHQAHARSKQRHARFPGCTWALSGWGGMSAWLWRRACARVTLRLRCRIPRATLSPLELHTTWKKEACQSRPRCRPSSTWHHGCFQPALRPPRQPHRRGRADAKGESLRAAPAAMHTITIGPTWTRERQPGHAAPVCRTDLAPRPRTADACI